MRTLTLLFTLVLLGQSAFAQYKYPTSKTVDVSDTFFGITITDPYRWLEDIKNPEVVDWFKAQADYTNAELAKIPNQEKLIQELKDYDAMRSVSYKPIAKAGGKYFYNKRLPGEQTSKLYYRQGENGKEVLLFDPQAFVTGKTFDFNSSVSDDGSKIALELSEAGTELGDIRILDVATGEFLPDIIPHSRGRFARGSNTEIFYLQAKSYDINDPENMLNRPFKLHILGTNVEEDVVLASSENNPELNFLPREIPFISVYKDSPYMVLSKLTVERNQTLYYALKSELKSGKIQWKSLTTISDEVRDFIISGTDIFFLTTKGNPRLKIIKTSLKKPDLNNGIAIAEGNDEWQISTDAYLFDRTKDYFFFGKTKNELLVQPYTYEFKTGKISEINVPLNGNVYVIPLSIDDNEVVLENLGWTIPYNRYSYNLKSKAFTDGIFHTKYNYPNLDNIVFEEVEIPSWDGTLVPLSIIYDKNKLKKDGSNIVYMEGYGAYGYTLLPLFNANSLPLLNRGVILAYAHVRGGGEKGNDWHLAGKKTNKPNSWKDFNACAEYLIAEAYTSPEKFAITGRSAGGALIGGAVTSQPDLYRVAIPKVGAMNVLRMAFSPSGPANVPEGGNVEIEEEFHVILEADAYFQTKTGVAYPAHLITAGYNDPRVIASYPAKYAAKMQVASASAHPVFLDVDFKAGHSGGSTMDEAFAQKAKEYAFLLWQCGNEEFQKTP